MSRLSVFQQSTKLSNLSQRLIVASFGIIIGSFILLGIGFASGSFIHNAAHDARHVNSFPCH